MGQNDLIGDDGWRCRKDISWGNVSQPVIRTTVYIGANNLPRDGKMVIVNKPVVGCSNQEP